MTTKGNRAQQRHLASYPLEDLDPDRIRAQWVELTETAPPRYVSRSLLRRMLADRIQCARHGGMPAELKRRLLKIAASVGKGRSKAALPALPPSLQDRLKPGTVLVRDFQGSRHQVLVLEKGFGFRGETFASLSEIARTITGTRWSGPAFFGLKTRRRASTQEKDAA
jgi:hypothetical protein